MTSLSRTTLSRTAASHSLSTAEASLLHEIDLFWKIHGHSPSMSELQRLLGYRSRSSIHRLVERLTDKKWLAPREAGKKRQLNLAENIIQMTMTRPQRQVPPQIPPSTNPSPKPKKHKKQTRAETPQFAICPELAVPHCSPREFRIRVHLLTAIAHLEGRHKIPSLQSFTRSVRLNMRAHQ